MPIAIGIGCFLFLYRDDDDFDEKTHLDNIVDALNRVDNISDVRVDGTTDIFTALEDPTGKRENSGLPLYCDLKISFDIYLPTRVQDQFMPNGRSNVHSEHFSVVVIQNFEFPVTYINYSLSSDFADDSPADSVVFIRNYLQDKLGATDSPLVFDVLGPTPLHTEVFLFPTEGVSDVALKSEKVRVGYPEMVFVCPPGASCLPPLHSFVSKYTPILGTYYYITMYRNMLLRQHVAVFQAANELLVSRRKISLFGRLMHFLSLKFRVETVLDALLENHSVNFGLRKYVAEKKRDSTLTDDSAFARFVSETLEDEFTIPVDEVRDIIRIVEERRLRYFQNSATLIAGGGGRSLRCVADLSLFDGRARSLSFDTELLLRVAVDRTLRSAGHRHRAGFEPSFKIAAPTSRKRFQRILQTRELAR